MVDGSRRSCVFRLAFRFRWPQPSRPLVMGCTASLSVVSQLLSVCNPSGSRPGWLPGTSYGWALPSALEGERDLNPHDRRQCCKYPRSRRQNLSVPPRVHAQPRFEIGMGFSALPCKARLSGLSPLSKVRAAIFRVAVRTASAIAPRNSVLHKRVISRPWWAGRAVGL